MRRLTMLLLPALLASAHAQTAFPIDKRAQDPRAPKNSALGVPSTPSQPLQAYAQTHQGQTADTKKQLTKDEQELEALCAKLSPKARKENPACAR